MTRRFPVLTAAATTLIALVAVAPAWATPSVTAQAPATVTRGAPFDVVYSGVADTAGTAELTGVGQNMMLRTFYERNAASCAPTAAAQRGRSESTFNGNAYIESPSTFSVSSPVQLVTDGAYRFCAYLEIGQTADTSPPAARAEVVVRVGDPPIPCTVPALRGLSQAAATRKLAVDGCAVGKVTRPKNSAGKKLVVRSQSRSSGTRLPAGATVDIVMRALPPCKVPKLKGLTQTAAKKKLTAAGCSIGKVRKPKKAGKRSLRVRSQSKAPGKRLAPRAKINVVMK